MKHDIETRSLLFRRVDSNGRAGLMLAAMVVVFLIVMSCVTIAVLGLLWA